MIVINPLKVRVDFTTTVENYNPVGLDEWVP